MNKISKKSLLLTVTALVVLAGTNFLTFALTNHHYSDYVLPKAKPVNNAEANGPRVEPKMNLDKTLPAGTISPSELVKDIQKYANKEVSVRGLITKNGSTYSIVSQNEERATSVMLNIDKIGATEIDKYAITASSPNPTQGQITISPATVNGTFQFTTADSGEISNIALVVTSIQK